MPICGGQAASPHFLAGAERRFPGHELGSSTFLDGLCISSGVQCIHLSETAHSRRVCGQHICVHLIYVPRGTILPNREHVSEIFAS
jgi:hypothetical protein